MNALSGPRSTSPQIRSRRSFLLMTLLVQGVILFSMWYITFHHIEDEMIGSFKQHTLWNNAHLTNELIDMIVINDQDAAAQIEANRRKISDLVRELGLSSRPTHFIGLEQATSNSVLLLTAFAAITVLSMTSVATWLLTRRYNAALENMNRSLENELQQRFQQSLKTRHALILGLAKLADYRDTDTGTHLDRICTYSCLLAEELRAHFKEIDDDWIECLRLAASLHDIGKVGIPDSVLLKPGALTEEDRVIIEKHPLIGADTILAIRTKLGDDMLLNMSLQIALGHHERWDGKGYPYGLAGDLITVAARIVALADVYDALTTKRVYKPAMPHDKARQIILEGRGTQFDPAVVDAFERIHEQFNAVRGLLQAKSQTGSTYRASAA